MGPVIVGRSCKIGPNVRLGPYTSLGDNCRIREVEIENSIVMEGSTIEGGHRVVDNLIGGNSRIVGNDGNLRHGSKFVLGERSFAQL